MYLKLNPEILIEVSWEFESCSGRGRYCNTADANCQKTPKKKNGPLALIQLYILLKC